MKICSHCILPDTFPGINFDSHGICSHCQKFDGKESKLSEDKKRYEHKFLELLSSLGISSSSTPYTLNPNPSSSTIPYSLSANRSSSLTANRYPYDILMAYSGGKDSTYTMSLLKNKYGLRILAMSFDNGFISPTSVANIKNVTDALGIDHIFFKPKWEILRKIFRAAVDKELYAKKTLERASTICTSCIGLVKSLCLKMAIEQDIPMIGFGWSPGQAPVQSSIMKTNPSLVRMSQQAIQKPLREVVGDAIDAYFLQDRHYAMPDRFPYNVHPMAWEYYHEGSLVEEIRKLGWVSPQDTDSNSSNCLLNAFANDVHIKRYGFHPYVWEIANMVREGVMTREEGYKKIYNDQSPELVEMAGKKLF